MTAPDLTASRPPEGVLLAPTATKLTEEMRGQVVLCGSHGGRYPGFLAANAGVRGVIFCDAGVGLENAGVGSLALLDGIGTPAATVASTGCRIGDAEDMAARGVVSFANEAAKRLGVFVDQPCLEAATAMAGAELAGRALSETIGEGRRRLPGDGGREIVLIDSVSLVHPEDVGRVIVTGSHGGLVGGAPESALGVDGFAAFFNDAGVGADEAGLSRLPALEARGIAGVTVAAATARIGDAGSTLEDGVVSHFNQTAAALGARAGMAAAELADKLARL